jgi:hypothetical protein
MGKNIYLALEFWSNLINLARLVATSTAGRVKGFCPDWRGPQA